MRIILIITIFLSSCFGNNKSGQLNNDTSKMHLKGKVKKLHQTKYEAIRRNDSVVVGNKWDGLWNDMEKQIEFNEYGNKISEVTYNGDESIYDKYEYQYNSDEKIIKQLYYNVNGKLIPPSKFSYNNSNNNLIEREDFILGGQLYKFHSYKYDNQNNLIEYRLEYLKNSEDSKGNDDIYTKSDYRMTYKYDKKNNKEEIKRFGFGVYTSKDSKSKYKYDNNHNLIEQQYFDPKTDAPLSKEIFEYNTDNLVIKKTTYYNDVIRSQEMNKYDNYGNITEVLKNEDGEQQTIQYKYLYDDHHNWIKQQKTENNKPHSIIIRSIEYYE